MATGAARRPVMTLYSDANCPYSHRVRIVLAEKSITADVIEIENEELPEDLIDLNPYHSIPTLVDRDLVLYSSEIIMQYLDDRYPHPPLMPVDPVASARCRMMLYRIDKDWYRLIDSLKGQDELKAERARRTIRDGLTLIAPIFEKMNYFMSNDFALVDCSMAPLLWRLPEFGIELPGEAKSVNEYAKRLFDRASFQASLTEIERDLSG